MLLVWEKQLKKNLKVYGMPNDFFVQKSDEKKDRQVNEDKLSLTW